jgi:hypothetical protein
MNLEEIKRAIRRGAVGEEATMLALRQDSPLSSDLLLMTAATLIKHNQQTARTILSKIDTRELALLITTGSLPPEMITLAAKIWPRSQPLREAIFASPFSPSTALSVIVPGLGERQIESLCSDELRLTLAPQLIDVLLNIAQLDDTIRQRLQNLKEKIAADEELRIRESFRPENLDEESKEVLLSENEEDEDLENENINIYALIKKMTVAERAMLALKANKNVRMLLIKDNSRLVARSVMRSPRLTEQDVEQIARTREVDEEILRTIHINKRWMRKYSIIKNLAFNPRTPLAISMGLCNRLSNTDVKSGSRDHNIPSALRQFIAKVAQKRGLR